MFVSEPPAVAGGSVLHLEGLPSHTHPPATAGGSDPVARGPFDPLGSEEVRQTLGRLFESFQPRAGRARARLPEDASDVERSFVASELRVYTTDEAVAFGHGQDVVAVPARRLGHERLEAVGEAEETERARAVA